MEKSCICSVLKEIDAFDGINEFVRFQTYLSKIVNDGDLKQVPAQTQFLMQGASKREKEQLEERIKQYPIVNGIPKAPKNQLQLDEWYECTLCKAVWRLVYPDHPFKGIWRKVIN